MTKRRGFAREKIPVHVENVFVISREFEPWYEAVRHQRSTMYWDHYEKYLAQEKKWPSGFPITTIDHEHWMQSLSG